MTGSNNDASPGERARLAFFALAILATLWVSALPSIGFCDEPTDAPRSLDTVRYLDQKTGREKKRKGKIVEYGGKALILQVASGNEVTIPVDRVAGVEVEWSDAHREGDRLFDRGDFAAAQKSYEQAISEDQQQWILRLLMARRTLCLSAQQQHVAAADSFFRIVKADPATQHFGVIPLNWQTRQVSAAMQQRCEQWLEEKSPVRQLVGASWLLSTPSRSNAMKSLDVLCSHLDSRIALLANAQLWRTQAASANRGDLIRWQGIIERMPHDLRPGPLSVCGNAMLVHKQNLNQSVLLLLRVPMLHSEHHQLAARCLSESATAMRTADRTAESDLMLHELIAEYPQTRYAAEAKASLKPQD